MNAYSKSHFKRDSIIIQFLNWDQVKVGQHSLVVQIRSGNLTTTLKAFCLFCLNGRLPKGKKVGIPRRILPLGTEPTFLLPQARSILTLWLPVIKPSTCLNTKQPCEPRQIGIQEGPRCAHRPCPGLTSSMVQTLCRPIQAFKWFSIQKPSTNSSVPVACITQPAKNSQLYPTAIYIFNSRSKCLCLKQLSKFWDYGFNSRSHM